MRLDVPEIAWYAEDLELRSSTLPPAPPATYPLTDLVGIVLLVYPAIFLSVKKIRLASKIAGKA
jgi:hypothetical protein